MIAAESVDIQYENLFPQTEKVTRVDAFLEETLDDLEYCWRIRFGRFVKYSLLLLKKLRFDLTGEAELRVSLVRDSMLLELGHSERREVIARIYLSRVVARRINQPSTVSNAHFSPTKASIVVLFVT